MQSDDARYLKRKVKAGRLDVHPTEQALVVHYELEAAILGEGMSTVLSDKKECQKIIRLKSLHSNTDIAALAEEVVEKCSLIHKSKLPEVEQLIYYLQNRRKEAGGSSVAKERPQTAFATEVLNVSNLSSPDGTLEVASLAKLEDYVDLLYENIPEKIRGSSLILQLARNPDNLQELSTNERILGALARVLREDWKQSLDLSTNIVYVFFCFSTFSVFHPVIIQHKMGSLCMELIDYELRRHDQWTDELEQRRRQSQNEAASPSEETKKKALADFERSARKFALLTKKQDQLLRVAFYLLLNIAEDTRLEDKMRRKNIVGMLVKALDRDNTDLLLLIVTFLKKLSVFRENKDDMADMNVVEKLPALVTSSNSDLAHVAMKLLFNISFDPELRSRMVRVGLLPKLVHLLDDPKHKSVVLGILYHLSMDDRVKSMFTYTDCIPLILKMIMECTEDKVPLEMVAVAINLALNKRNAQLMCEGPRLKTLMQRAFHYQDPLLMKCLRNIAQHPGQTKILFVEFIGDLAQAIQAAECEEFVVECLGVMGNLAVDNMDWERLMKEYKLIPWLRSHLVSGRSEDDLVLEIVVLLGTTAMDEACANLLCKAEVLQDLIELLKAKQEDDEVVLQIIFVFFQLCKHPASMDYLIQETGMSNGNQGKFYTNYYITEAAAYLIDLMHDKNAEIRRVCDNTLDIIGTHYPDWAKRIQLEKFRFHNSQWLEMVKNQQAMDAAAAAEGEDQMPYYGDDLYGPSCLYQPDTMDDFDFATSSENSSRASSRPRSSYGQDLEGFMDAMGRPLVPGSKQLDDLNKKLGVLKMQQQ
ncbi:kinesin-associated protein 3 isoform X1 [Neocloeon triangulifer]|uniref:kinesin-associated protein 3 isoform X1 n=1 Tax=Neocloeon triangulifer TaxID=2078957 RepID=UPI00286F4295|nr:kinesin-associated protein 3 isoform X1 [Neocloeon triangulifer]